MLYSSGHSTAPSSHSIDPYGLQKFFDQAHGFEVAVAEIRSGRKRGHWSWWFFPVAPYAPNGIERGSEMNRYYALRDAPGSLSGDEAAKAFLSAPLHINMSAGKSVSLRSNYLEMMTAVVEQLSVGVTSLALVGPLDQPKLRNSLLLFQKASTKLDDAEILTICTKGLEHLDGELHSRGEL